MKRIIALLLVLCMAMVVFTGCKNNEQTPKEQTATEALTEAPTVPEVTYNLTFNAFSYNDVNYNFVFKGVDANVPDQKFNTISFIIKDGDIIKDAINFQGFGGFKVESKEDEFLGFMEYKCTTTQGEDGTATNLYEKVSGDTLYSIDEILEKEMPAYDVAYVARWKSIDDDYYAAYGY